MVNVGEKIILEDTYVDILQKAQQGLYLSWGELAHKTGVPLERIQQVVNGCVDKELIEQLAFALNLHAPSLINIATDSWYSHPIEAFPGLAMFTTWYGNMTVNAYLVWDPQTREAASFDTGASCQPMLDYLSAHQFTLKQIFITHTHPDHLADLAVLQKKNKAQSYGSAIENPLKLTPLQHGDTLALGGLKIDVLGTHGHTPGGLSYYIHGLARPVVVVGDALFAGSMGRAIHAYQDALRNNQEYILQSLPENTVICPGHGPLSSVGEEKANNPFFPELKSL